MRKYLAKKMIDKSTKHSSIKGVSLTEVLFATALTGVVISAAGYGVSSLVSSSNAAGARSDRRAELNRSLDFMSSEIRESTGIEKIADTAANPAGFTPLGSGASKVLMVKTADTGATPIIYYTATPASGTWKGPRVVYRWGPTFDNRGNYTNASTPTTWTHEVLIDNISPASANTQIIGGIPGTGRNCTYSTANPNNGGTYNGDSGFNACVDAAGRTAVIRQDGQIAKVLGASENYIASTNTGARKISTQGPTPSSLPSGATTASLTPSCPSSATFSIVNGGVCVPNAQNITVEIIPGGYPVATSLRVAVKPTGTVFTNTILNAGTPQTVSSNRSKTYNIPAGSTISMAGCSNGSGNMNGPWQDYANPGYEVEYCPTSTDPSHQGNTVYTLKNGDTIPTVAGAGKQASLATILTNAGMSSASGKVVAQPNQIIYLFEVATEQKTHAYHDLQDIVVKVTF
jgi:hypothetical protein